MDLQNSYKLNNAGKRVKKSNPPLITFTEFAELQNITVSSLRAYAGNSVTPMPSPVTIHNNAFTQKNSWYNKKEMQAWWDTRVSKPSPCKL